MDLSGFNADDFPASDDYSALPAGTYTAAIIASESKQTKSGTGSYLELTLEVVDGQYKGRKIWDRLNLQNPNQTAMDIALRTLASICQAVGVTKPRDSAELHNKPMQVTLAIRNYNGNDSNEVKKYTSVGSKSPVVAPVTRATEKAPWE